jgi:hypothetical protein
VAGVALSPDSFISSSDPDGSRPLLPDSISQAFDRLCRRLELPALTASVPTHSPNRRHPRRHPWLPTPSGVEGDVGLRPALHVTPNVTLSSETRIFHLMRIRFEVPQRP